MPAEPAFELFCATADAFAAPTQSRETEAFPGGYHEIACWLQKGVIWSCWSITSHGKPLALLDGLVEVAPDRWAWCPRPWKVLPKPQGPTLYWDE